MGFDNECILNIQSLAGEYFCPVCRTLVYPNEALQSQCSHLYCRLCLTYVVGTTRACPYDGYLVTEADSKPLIESNKALAETIGRIAVRCLFHRSGCTWQGPLSECTTHCSGCAFGHSPVVCNRCGIQIVHRQVQEHAQTCPGVNLQAQQVADVVQESVTSAAAATAANQTQTGTQSGAPPSQDQPQVVAVPTTQGQAATTASQPTQEQQHQQSYQHVYDPYQFYAQQQLATQQFQQFQPNVQGQLQPQVHTQPQAPSQAQQHHHHQPQPQTHSQPQPQVPPHGQPQYNAYAQGPVAQHNQAQVNAQQLHPVVQPHIQDISQSYPPPHGLVPLQAQPYLHPRPQPVQPHQQHMQTPQYQHPHAQMEPQQQQHSQTHTQASQLHPPPQIHPQLSPPVPNVQPQSQQPSSQAVTGHHSYPQVQAHQQMIPALPPQSPSHTQPSSGSLPPAQIRGQFPPPPPQMRPPQSHTLLPNQQPPALLPSQGQVPNIPPAQQQQIHPHTPQPGHAVQQRPVMLQIQQPVPQQYAQQPFPGQIGPVQTQLHQHTPFAQHQPMQSQLHPQGPPHAMQQSSPALLQPQQGVALAHDVHSHPSQNYAGRPAVPNLGVQHQPFSQYSGAFGVPFQVRSMQLGSNQTSGHQSQQFGPSIKTTMERKGDVLSDGTVVKQEAGSPSQKTVGKGNNGGRADSLNVKALKSETGLKFLDDEHKPVESEDNSRHGGTLAKDIDSKVHAVKDGFGEPVVKQTVKEEGNDHSVEANNVSMQSSVGIDSGSQALPPPPTSNRDGSHQNAIPHGNIQSPLVSRDCMQHSYQGTTQGLGFDESGGLGKGFVHSSHPGLFTDQGRHQLPPMPYGPSTHHQRPGILSMFQSGPLPGPPSNEQAPGYPPNLLRPQGPGHLSQPGQPLNPPEHYLAPGSKQHGSSHPDTSLGGFPSSGSTVLFGTGPGHFGNLQRSFELQSSAPQKQYGEGHMPLPHVGFPMSSQGEPVGGKALGAAPPGSFDPQGGIRGRAPPLVYESQFGPQHPINPVQIEMFRNQRPHDFDGRHPDSHVPGYLERGSFGQPSGIESGKPRMNGAPGQDSSSTIGLRDERFKSIIEERPDPFSIGQTRQFDQEFEEGSKQLPRHSHLGLEASPKFGSYFSSSRTTDRGPNGLGLDASLRPLDKPPRGFNYDAGLKMDSGYGGVPSRFLPPYHTGGVLHPNDAGERAPSFGGNDDSGGRADSARAHQGILGSVLGFGLHHMEHLTPRSPGREYLGISSRGFGQSSFVDIDSREPHSFGEGSRSFNLPPDQGGNSSRGSRFPILPGHLRRGELGGPGNSRMGEHLRAELIGQDNLPILFRRGELLGHHNLSSHLPLGELDGPGSFPHHQPFGESFSGTKVSHPRLGEPGFRSSYSIHGFPNDGGFHLGDTSSFDQLRKRKPASTGWCRICEVDCETVEGLELHSQTREHQKMTMDMVIKIKQQNAKKHKISNDHSRGDASKSRNAGFEGRANKP